MRPYLELLRRPGAISITIAHGLGRFTPGMILLALILALREAWYAYAAVGLVTGAHQLGVAISSPIQGRLADVLGHRRVLLPDGLIYFAGTATLALGVQRSWTVTGLVLVAFGTGLFSPPMTACARAAFGAMFTGRERERAFIVTASNIEIGFLLGPLMAVAIAATLAVVPSVPVAGMALILGVDRFMSECRALTNFVGNAVATIVVAKWEKGLDREALDRALAGGPTPVTVGAVEVDDD